MLICVRARVAACSAASSLVVPAPRPHSTPLTTHILSQSMYAERNVDSNGVLYTTVSQVRPLANVSVRKGPELPN